MDENLKRMLVKLIGSLIFVANKPVSVDQIKKCLENTSSDSDIFRSVKEDDILIALEELKIRLIEAGLGFHLVEVAGGYRLQSDRDSGPWVKTFLCAGKKGTLSRPCLETLAIIAYKQPITRSEIESIRGVNVEGVLANLLEMRLIKISGRSDAPGRPFLYSTTQQFLEYFGLKDLKEFKEIINGMIKEEKNKAIADGYPSGQNNAIKVEPSSSTVEKGEKNVT